MQQGTSAVGRSAATQREQPCWRAARLISFGVLPLVSALLCCMPAGVCQHPQPSPHTPPAAFRAFEGPFHAPSAPAALPQPSHASHFPNNNMAHPQQQPQFAVSPNSGASSPQQWSQGQVRPPLYTAVCVCVSVHIGDETIESGHRIRRDETNQQVEEETTGIRSHLNKGETNQGTRKSTGETCPSSVEMGCPCGSSACLCLSCLRWRSSR